MGWVVKNNFLDVFPNTNTQKQQQFVKVLEWHRTINTTTSVAKFGVQVLVPSAYMYIYIQHESNDVRSSEKRVRP